MSNNAPCSHPVPHGKRRICIAGFKVSTFTSRARRLAGKIGAKYADRFETWFYFDEQPNYYQFLKEKFDPVPFPQHLKGHESSPFIWIEEADHKIVELLGGCHEFMDWIRKEFPQDQELKDDMPETCERCRVGCCTFPIFHDKDAGAAQPTAALIPAHAPTMA